MQASATEAFRSFTEPIEPPELAGLIDEADIAEEPAPTKTPKAKAKATKATTATKATKATKARAPKKKAPSAPRQVAEPKAARAAKPQRPRREPRLATSRDWNQPDSREPNAVQTLIATARKQAASARPPAEIPAPKAAPEDTAPSVPEEAVEPAPAEVPAAKTGPKAASQPPKSMEMPWQYEFTPLKSSRRILTVVLLCGLAASSWLGYSAYQTRDELLIGIAAIAGFTTAVIWAARAGATPTRLAIRNGLLEVRRQGSRFVFDLASTYTPITVVGVPGKRGWKVMFLRRGMPPFVVNATMVDPHEFMRALRFFRPE